MRFHLEFLQQIPIILREICCSSTGGGHHPYCDPAMQAFVLNAKKSHFSTLEMKVS